MRLKQRELGSSLVEASPERIMKPPSEASRIDGRASLLDNFSFEHRINRADAGRGNRDDEIFSASTHAVKQARSLAIEHPRSVFAQARLLPLEVAVDAQDNANTAALKLIDLAREQSGQDQVAIGPALRVAVDQLVNANLGVEADRQLERFPRSVVVDEIRAQVKVAIKDFESGLLLLNTATTPRSMYLAAVCLVELGQYQAAAAKFRSALARAPKDVDLLLLGYRIFDRLGSKTKSKRLLQQAAALEPGRRDVSMTVLGDAVESGDVDYAQQMLRSMRRAGVVVTADFLLLEALCASLTSEDGKAISLLREAATLAESNSDLKLQANIEANLYWYQYLAGRASSAAARGKIRAIAVSNPKESYVIRALIGVSSSRTDGLDAASFVDAQGSPIEMDVRDHALSRLYFLCGRYRDAIEAAERVWVKDPGDPANASLLMLLVAQFGGSKTSVKSLVDTTIRHVGLDSHITNAAAYLLAVNGLAREGLQLLNSVRPFRRNEYVLLATSGLALIANGQFEDGMKLYRQAAEVADRQKERPGRALMTLHQAAALRRLPLSKEAKERISALALPEAPMPVDWKDDPSFLLMKAVADEKGWSWPIRPVDS